MTMKYDQLVSFCEELLLKRKYVREIGFHTLEHEIAKYFNSFTKYKIENIKTALLKFRFVERVQMADRFRIVYGEKKQNIVKITKDEIKEKFGI